VRQSNRLEALVDEAERLLADGSPSSRSLVAAAVAKIGELPRLKTTQVEEWRHLVDFFARDPATVVRAVLAETVKRNANVSAGTAERLAHDVIDVARPILAHSDLLSDTVLIDVIAGGDPQKQDAIAGRSHVSEDVSRVIIDGCAQAPVARLAANKGAVLSDADLERILERFEDAWPVLVALAKRDRLPASVAEKVIARVSNRLNANYRGANPSAEATVPSPSAPASDATPIEQVAAMTSAPVSPQATRAGEGAAFRPAEASRALARQWHQQGKLSPLLALKALCTGDLAFFETAVSLRSGLPLPTVQSMLHDPRVRGFNSVNEKARIPGTFLPVIRAALSAIAETPFDGMPGDRDRFVETVIARILTQVDEIGADLLEFLAARFQPASGTAR
jgi:uncharacterized protein (DUF2336 family)